MSLTTSRPATHLARPAPSHRSARGAAPLTSHGPPHLTARLAARRRSPRTASHHGEAALAEFGVVPARADLLAPGPAALALPAPRLVHADDEARDLLALIADGGLRLRRLLFHLRDDEERGQERALGTEERGQILGRAHQEDARLEPAPDEPTRARGLERLRDLAAYLEEAAPLPREPVVEPLHRLLGEPLEMDALAPGAGQVAPGLLGGERQNRRQEPRERGEDVVARRLGRPPTRVVARRGVETVLDDVEVLRRKVHGAEVVDRVEDRVELVLLVRAPDAPDEPPEPVEDEAVELVQARIRLPVALGHEIAQVAEQEAERVADAPIGVGEPIQNLEGDPDVLGIVLGRHPQAKDLGTVLRQEVVEADDVAERLGHLPSLAVDEKAVRDHALVRRRPARADRLEQRGLEPAAVLVRSLEVHLGRPADPGPRLEHRRVAAPGVEPDVEDVRLLPEPRAAALRAPRARRQEARRPARVPLVGALSLTEDPGDVLHDPLLRSEERRVGKACRSRGER